MYVDFSFISYIISVCVLENINKKREKNGSSKHVGVPKFSGLLAHAKTSKYMAAAALYAKGRKQKLQLQSIHSNNDCSKAELLTALFVTTHVSIRTVDHLSNMQKVSFTDSKIAADVKLGTTKCSALIKNTLSPYFLKLLLTDIGEGVFSLIIDESTDISVKKYVVIIIRYFSESSKDIINTFLK